MTGAGSNRPKALYSTRNTRPSTYWLYHKQVNSGETVLFGKKMKSKDGVKSSFGAEVYDEYQDKYKVMLKPNIANFEKWKTSKNAYKFFACERHYTKEDYGEVKWIYFYTISPIKSANAMRNKSNARAEFCVEFTKMTWPKMITRTNLVSNFLESHFKFDTVIEEVSHGDAVYPCYHRHYADIT